MPEQLFSFTEAQVARLKKIAEAVEVNERPPLTNSHRSPTVPSRIIIGALESSVSATTALLGKPKVGTLNVYTFSSTGTEDTGRDETVYNFAPQAATTDRWTICERDNTCGKWIITTQFCS